MDDQAENSVTAEVENRLEDLFWEDDDNTDDIVENGTFPADSPLKDLKATMLSIDWEITDEIMAELIEQVEKLKNTYKNDKMLMLFLKLLGSVGNYIKSRKANSHPDSMKVLKSVYNSLEKVVLSEDIEISEKKRILTDEINRFNQLKEVIVKMKVKPASEHAAAVKPMAAEDDKSKDVPLVQMEKQPPVERETYRQEHVMQNMPPHEAFAFALDEIKNTIKAEFQALRAELKLWR